MNHANFLGGEYRRQTQAQGGVFVAVALFIWFVAVVALGSAGAFVGRPGTPPVAIALGVTTPLLIYFASLRFSRSFRDLILSLDVRVVTAIQAWRWAGLDFLFLYAYHILPGVFALPAGLGDMAVGLTAPMMLARFLRGPNFIASSSYLRWNLFGIFDLVVALSIGAIGAARMTGAPGEISTAPLATLPLLIIPVFLVPFFLMLHATALMQRREFLRA